PGTGLQGEFDANATPQRGGPPPRCFFFASRARRPLLWIQHCERPAHQSANGGDGMRTRGALIGLVLIITAVTPALAEDDPRWLLSTSVNYSVGDYGTNKDTTIVSVPVTFGVRPVDQLWISLTLPWIYQSGENVVVTAGGVAVRKKGGSGKFARPERSTSESGVGDLLLKVSYTVLEERDFVPEIAPYVKIKFPTADSDRGLGTGEFDETIGGDLRIVERIGRLGGLPGIHISVLTWSFRPAPATKSLRAHERVGRHSPRRRHRAVHGDGVERALEVKIGKRSKLEHELARTKRTQIDRVRCVVPAAGPAGAEAPS